MIFETQHLILREFEPDDAESLHPVFSDPEVNRFTLRRHISIKETLEWIKAIRQSYKRDGLGPLAVILKKEHRLIGYCGCGIILLENKRECEIGYRIIRSEWNNGYATEAARVCLDIVFDRFSFHRIVSLIQPENKASVRVAEKSGMNCHGEVIFEDRPMLIYAKNTEK